MASGVQLTSPITSPNSVNQNQFITEKPAEKGLFDRIKEIISIILFGPPLKAPPRPTDKDHVFVFQTTYDNRQRQTVYKTNLLGEFIYKKCKISDLDGIRKARKEYGGMYEIRGTEAFDEKRTIYYAPTESSTYSRGYDSLGQMSELWKGGGSHSKVTSDHDELLEKLDPRQDFTPL